jgi:tetratricopeptide (TPR) repeat protein
VTRAWLPLALAAAVAAQESKPKPADPAEPPEEDVSLVEKEYAFNPLQAAKEYEVGNFYFKRGSFPAAAKRYEEATKWNPQYADAYYRLGESLERMAPSGKDKVALESRAHWLAKARTAYEKFIEVAPEDRRAAAAKKKLASLK